MRTTEERMDMLLKKHKTSISTRREKHLIRGLSVLCMILSSFVFFIAVNDSAMERGISTVPKFYGSVLLHEGMGEFVFVGVIAFTVGVAVTVLCLRYNMKAKRKKEKDK